MRTSKTILSILHRGFDKIEQGARVMASDEKSAKKLYNRLSPDNSDGDAYKITFETEKGLLKDVLSPSNNWLTPKAIITRCDLLPRLFCIDATLLCEFESDKI